MYVAAQIAADHAGWTARVGLLVELVRERMWELQQALAG